VSFYRRDALVVARELLGCRLCRLEEDGSWTWGVIVETEAYMGEDDPACHAAAGPTPRNRVLYGPPGRAYVYFNYGMHHLFNAVTGPRGYPAAVLIRALEPGGDERAMAGRRIGRTRRELTSGPGRLCRALGIDLRHNQGCLRTGVVRIRNPLGETGPVSVGPRIGIRQGRDRPWRLWIDGNPYVSRGRPGRASASPTRP